MGESSCNANCENIRVSETQLHVLYYNARSLLPKLDELRATVTLEQPHIVCVVETWLSPDITDNELQISGYQLVRLDRNRNGGGIAMYVSDLFSFRVLLQSGPYNLEFLAVILSSSNFKFCVSLFYRPPSSPVSIFDELFFTLQILNPFYFSTFLLLGDFNVNFCNSSHHLLPHLNHVVHSFSLTQVVSSFTRVHHNGTKSLIDLAFLSDVSKLSSCETISSLGSSDHRGISLSLNMRPKHRSGHSRLVWLYDQADFNKARNLIHETDWESLLQGPIDECALVWQQTFLAIMEKCIPRRALAKNRRLPWIKNAVLKLISKRNVAFRKAKKSGKPSDVARYSKLRNKVVSVLRASKRRYFTGLNTSNKKQFWKTFKVATRKESLIPTLVHDNNEANSDKEKAEMLSNYFAKSFNTLVPPLCSEYCNYSESDSVFLDDLACTEEEVCFILKSINASKATGPDGISARMLKETASAIAPSLTILFNSSISQRCFPTCWKLANVVPVPKSISQKTSPSGYRPISLLPIVSKIFEKHIYMFISDYLAEYHPIACNQWGFQPQRSCTTTLLTTTYDWYGTMDKGKDVVAVFFDFQKAFDSVPHGPLITKLQNIGLHPHLVMWVKSYLTNRSQRVVLNGSESTTIDVLSGVPQGSVLGPLLFLIYINDLCAITLSTGSKVTMYADDLVLHKVVDAETAFIRLQKDINNIVQWSRSNKVNLNKSKCKVMLFSHKRHAMPPVFIENEQMEQVRTYKYLGLTITSTLKWDEHIDQLCLRAKKLLGYLYRLFYRNVQPTSLCNLFTALIRPILEYASQVWDPYTLKNKHKIENLQKYALRISSGRWAASYEELLDHFKLPTLASRREYLRVTTLHKLHSGHSYLPPDILKLQPVTSTRSCSSTSNSYRIPFARTAQFQNSFLPRTLQVWNNLPYDIIDNDHSSFKCILRHMLL